MWNTLMTVTRLTSSLQLVMLKGTKAAMAAATGDNTAQATNTAVRQESLTSTKSVASGNNDTNEAKPLLLKHYLPQMTKKEHVELNAKKFDVSEEEAEKIACQDRFGLLDDGLA